MVTTRHIARRFVPRVGAAYGSACPCPCRARPRRGSALVLVVGLLTLLTLIGTAWLVTSRTEVVAAGRHADNTRADGLADGVENVTTAAIRADLVGTGALREAARGYCPWDDAGTDAFL